MTHEIVLERSMSGPGIVVWFVVMSLLYVHRERKTAS